MRSSIKYFALLLLFSLAGYAVAEEAKTITVNGKATRTAKPDVAYVTVYVKSEGILMVDAAKKADELTEKVVTAIKEGRPEITNIEVKSVSVGEESSYSFDGDKPPAPQITKRIRVTCQADSQLVYAVVDAAIRAGAIMNVNSETHFPSEMSGVVVFGLTNGQEIFEDLAKDALSDARKSAEKIAVLASKRVGDITAIACNHNASFGGSSSYFSEQQDYPSSYLSTDADKIEVVNTKNVVFELLGE